MVLKVLCAFCDKLLYNPPSACADDELGVTHTICPECRDRMLDDTPIDRGWKVKGTVEDESWEKDYDLGGEG